jgi:hypothetical protein
LLFYTFCNSLKHELNHFNMLRLHQTSCNAYNCGLFPSFGFPNCPHASATAILSQTTLSFLHNTHSILNLLMPLNIADTSQPNFSPESKSKLSYDRRSFGQSVLISSHHLGPAINFSFTSIEILFRQLGGCYYKAASLRRWLVWNVQLLLCFASAAFVGSESRGALHHILSTASRLKTSQPGGPSSWMYFSH